MTKLKICAIKALEFDDFVRFIGIRDYNNRLSIFNHFKEGLEPEEVKYWENNSNLIKMGIINCGKFERYLAKFRKYFLPLIISKKRINEFLSLGSLSEQESFYRKYWDNWRFRSLFRIFFSRKGLESGRDKQYFKYSSQGRVSDYYLARVKHSLIEIPIETNFFMQYILTGTISAPLVNHPYLDKKNFSKLKAMLNNRKIEFRVGDIHEFLKNLDKESFSKFNLSDIFEAKTQEEYGQILSEIVRISKKRSRLCYWNNLANRFEHTPIAGLVRNSTKSEDLYKKDRVHFYSKFVVENIN